jgi:hypothetical protein
MLTPCSISDINKECLDQFRSHWQCLENHNQQLWNCRSEERRLNKCVFEKLVSTDLSNFLGLTADHSSHSRRRYQMRPRARRLFT